MTETPEVSLTILDEVLDHLETYLSITRPQGVAMTLMAAATWATPALVTTFRGLWVSDEPESGKTEAMMRVAELCANPQDVSGTSYALQSSLAMAQNTPEVPRPTFYCDEISDIFGRSGLSGSRSPIAEVLRKGYKFGATKRWSVNRVPETFSIFTPFLMTGLKVAVPADIRSRCIVITMKAGTPKRYFDVRTGEQEAAELAEALGQAVKTVMPDIYRFRARGLHPKLVGRRLEVWEGLLACATLLGGQRWLNMGVAAFTELAINGSAQLALTPRQRIVEAAAELLNGPLARDADAGFIPGRHLADELGRLPRFKDYTEDQLSKRLADELVPMGIRTRQVRGLSKRGFEEDRMSGYLPDEIRAAWEKIRPDDLADVEMPDLFEDPFDVSKVAEGDFETLPGDDSQAAVTPGTPGKGGKGGKVGEADSKPAEVAAAAPVAVSTRAKRAPRAVPPPAAVTRAAAKPPAKVTAKPPRASARSRAALPAVEQKFLIK